MSWRLSPPCSQAWVAPRPAVAPSGLRLHVPVGAAWAGAGVSGRGRPEKGQWLSRAAIHRLARSFHRVRGALRAEAGCRGSLPAAGASQRQLPLGRRSGWSWGRRCRRGAGGDAALPVDAEGHMNGRRAVGEARGLAAPVYTSWSAEGCPQRACWGSRGRHRRCQQVGTFLGVQHSPHTVPSRQPRASRGRGGLCRDGRDLGRRRVPSASAATQLLIPLGSQEGPGGSPQPRREVCLPCAPGPGPSHVAVPGVTLLRTLGPISTGGARGAGNPARTPRPTCGALGSWVAVSSAGLCDSSAGAVTARPPTRTRTRETRRGPRGPSPLDSSVFLFLFSLKATSALKMSHRK